MASGGPLYQVATLLGEDAYVTLLSLLPDSFFDLDEQAKDAFWKQALAALNAGETDLDRLAGMAATQDEAIIRVQNERTA